MARMQKTATKKAKAKASKAPKAKSQPTGKRPDGSISSGIYDQVEELVADGKMTRSAAFRQIAKESGRKEGTVAVNYYYAAKKRGKTGRRRMARKTAAKPAAKTAKSGSVSEMIYDAIEKLVAGETMTRAAAFRHHAKATGRKEGTIAVNYYYAAKKRGAKLLKRGQRKVMAALGRNGASSRVESMLKSLADMIRAQEAELVSLRRENERFAAIRRLVG